MKACVIEKWACAGLAALEYRSGNIDQSVKLYETACNANFFQACTDLGDLKPQPKKKFYFKKGCEGGSMEGCNNLAFLIEKDSPDDALALYKKACDSSFFAACNSLALLYYKNGNLQRSLKIYKYACDNSYEEACKSVPKIESIIKSKE